MLFKLRVSLKFGCLIELACSVIKYFDWTVLPGVLWVLPDSYLDVPNKDYGGQCFQILSFLWGLGYIIRTKFLYLVLFNLMECTFQGICLSMGKSYLDHNTGSMRGNKRVGTGLDHVMIGGGKQCRFKGESQCRAGQKTLGNLCSSRHSHTARVQLKVDQRISLLIDNVIGRACKNSQHIYKILEMTVCSSGPIC